LTVAHGDAFGGARRFADREGLPLASIFHDWYPDAVLAHRYARTLLEKRFRGLYRASKVAFCVSEQMRVALGAHHNAQVLFPIPSASGLPRWNSGCFRKASPFKMIYAGNLYEYGPMMAGALLSISESKLERLEIRGANPQWSLSLQTRMKASRNLFDFTSGTEFNEWLKTADAFLIPMSFVASIRRRMETSFPSKLTEFARFGRPLVIWGPEYCSAVKWARNGDRGLCVTRPSANTLRETVETLCSDSIEQRRLGEAALSAAQTEFNADRIHNQFIAALEAAMHLPTGRGENVEVENGLRNQSTA
jgi:glycosyltransferase involved in cell wall biosynthesis